MTHDLHHLAAAYALDALDIDERRAFEAHYTACEICVREVREFRAVTEHLAEGVATAPPEDLKARLMREVSQTRQVSPRTPDKVVDFASRRRLRVPRPLLLGAVAAAIIVIVGFATVLRTGPSGSETEKILNAADAVVTTLSGGPGSLQVAWSPELDRVAIFGNGVPEAGQGKAYELWFLHDDGVTRAALFDAADNGSIRQVLDVQDLADTTGWGVTVEPATGSDQPTGDIVYSATF